MGRSTTKKSTERDPRKKEKKAALRRRVEDLV
jgi:hypothetical protein